tara:strand:+ start:2169 stop:2636 length:468 start_codon:yes stop_codon:yes gene_type:complete
MSTLKTVSFFTVAGNLQTINITSFDVETQLLFFNKPFEEAIDGSLRQNVRGTRKKFSIFFNKCLEPSTMLSIFNKIVEDLNVEGHDRGSFDFFQGFPVLPNHSSEFFDTSSVFFDSSIVSRHTVTLDSSTVHQIQYTNQIGTYVPKINMIETTIT